MGYGRKNSKVSVNDYYYYYDIVTFYFSCRLRILHGRKARMQQMPAVVIRPHENSNSQIQQPGNPAAAASGSAPGLQAEGEKAVEGEKKPAEEEDDDEEEESGNESEGTQEGEQGELPEEVRTFRNCF